MADRILAAFIFPLSLSITAAVAAAALPLAAWAVFLLGKKRRKKNRKAQMDSLTGIGNAKYFRQRFSRYAALRSDRNAYLVYTTLYLQQIEISFGEAEAQELQQYAARVLAEATGRGELAASLGGGAFACLLHCSSDEQMQLRVSELLSRLNGYKDHFLEECRTVFRAGVSRLKAEDTSYASTMMHVRQAYRYAHRNKLAYTIANEDFLNRERNDAQLQSRLLDALKHDEFKLYMQFVVDADTGEIVGAEALSRWFDPENGILQPARYIDALHATGMIAQLDFFVFEEACRQLEKWSETGNSHLYLASNFARTTFSSGYTSRRISEIAQRYAFDRGKLIIEITEDSIADDQVQARRNIMTCKELGFSIALDDLGSGYSSFADLCDYPIDVIKIDQTLVKKSSSPRGEALLRGLIKLAHDMHILVIAEGIEHPEQDDIVKKADTDMIQGFLYSPVISGDEADVFLCDYRAPGTAANR